MNKSQSSSQNRPNNLNNTNSISDPLGESWLDAFNQFNGRIPTDDDRQDRLFSLLHNGSGLNGHWVDEDWNRYKQDKTLFWTARKTWKKDVSILDFDRFISHLEQLAAQYNNKPEKASEFSRAVGLIWGGIAYDRWITVALLRAAVGDHLLQLNEGTQGWLTKYVDDANPAHHWAAAFLTGFYYGTFVSIVASTTRDIAQYLTGLGGTKEDISLGIVGAKHCSSFKQNTKATAEGIGPYLLLFKQIRQDLQQK